MARRRFSDPFFMLWAILLVAAGIVVVINVSTGSGEEGSLAVRVNSLPQHLRANVVIRGPGGKHWDIQHSRTLREVQAGRYTVTAKPVSGAVFKYSATNGVQVVTLSGGSQTVEVQYLNMVRRSVHSVEIRTCTDNPIAILGHTLVFAPTAVGTKGGAIAQGTVLYIPTCGVRPHPLVVQVTSVGLGPGIVAATTKLLSDSGVFPLEAVSLVEKFTVPSHSTRRID